MKFIKVMSATDCGKSNTHQAGMLIPKSNAELLRFMPSLDLTKQNPDAIFRCVDTTGERWEFRYIYYNKKLFGTGTRNEYRLTGLTALIRRYEVRPGDELIFSRNSNDEYFIEIVHQVVDLGGSIKLAGWRQVF
jgi:hypothetical protein